MPWDLAGLGLQTLECEAIVFFLFGAIQLNIYITAMIGQMLYKREGIALFCNYCSQYSYSGFRFLLASRAYPLGGKWAQP